MTDRHYEEAKQELLDDRKLFRRTMVASTLPEIKDLFKTNCGGQYCDWCKKPVSQLLQVLKPKLKALPIKREAAHA